jgi:hypothetical protein
MSKNKSLLVVEDERKKKYILKEITVALYGTTVAVEQPIELQVLEGKFFTEIERVSM